jgi:hypothetical protein
MAKQPVKVDEDEDDDRPQFDDVYNVPVTQLQRRKPVPSGTYMGQTTGLPEEMTSPKKGTRYAQYTVRLLEPARNDRGHNRDVDQDALDEALTRANGEKINLSDVTLRLPMWRTMDSGHRHVEFLKKLGIEEFNEDGSERTLPDMIAESPGRTAFFHVKHNPSADGENVYAEIDRVIKMPQE